MKKDVCVKTNWFSYFDTGLYELSSPYILYITTDYFVWAKWWSHPYYYIESLLTQQ